MPQQVEHLSKGGVDVIPAGLFGSDGPFRSGDLFIDATLFGLEVVEAQRTVQIGVEQAPVSVLEFREALLLTSSLAFDLNSLCFYFGVDGLTSGFDNPLGQRDLALVVSDNGGLDSLNRGVGLVTALPAPRAEEVVVNAAVATVTREDQAGAAAPTVETALEVMVMRAPSLTGNAALVEDGLHSLEQVGGDEWLVLTLVFDTLEGDDADVVAVAQHVGDSGLVQGQCRLAADRY